MATLAEKQGTLVAVQVRLALLLVFSLGRDCASQKSGAKYVPYPLQHIAKWIVLGVSPFMLPSTSLAWHAPQATDPAGS